MIRLLDINDCEQLDNLLKAHNLTAQNPKLNAQDMLSDKDAIRHGYFKNGELLSTSTLRIYSYNEHANRLGVISLILQKPMIRFNPVDNGLVHCIDASFKYGEDQTIYNYFTWSKYRDINLSAKRTIWQGTLTRYSSFIEEYLPPNYSPNNNKFYQLLMYDTIKPEWSVIRSHRLKNEYRFPNHPLRIVGPNVDKQVDDYIEKNKYNYKGTSI